MCSWHIMTTSKAFLWDKSHHLRHIFVVTCVIMHHTFYLDDFILFLNNHNWHIFSSNGLFWWWVMKDLDLQLLQWVKILKISFGLVEKYWFDVFWKLWMKSLTSPMDDGKFWKQCEWKQKNCATTKWWNIIASQKLKGWLREIMLTL